MDTQDEDSPSHDRLRHATMAGDVSTSSAAGPFQQLRWGADGVNSPMQALGLPVGTVTFLLTDVASSTRMWGAEDEGAMRAAVVRHYEILDTAVQRNQGVRPLEQGEGDSIVAAFARPSDALEAATEAQLALDAEAWPTSEPLLVRMAVHTGEAHLRDDANYAGQAIIRAARLRSIAHGGQVLASGGTRDLVVDQAGDRFDLRSMGEHRLRDLDRPEHVWQLIVPGLRADFEPLTSARSAPNSLPAPLSRFIGRTAEIATLSQMVTTDRLVTATGSGGAGKTRLAREVGADLIGHFPAGVWWAELAPVDSQSVEAMVRAAFGINEGAAADLEESVRRQLGEGRGLLILDNCEHVAGTVRDLADRLLRHAPNLHILATSRVMLDLPGEAAWRVPPLGLPDPTADSHRDDAARSEAVALFVDRARRARPNFELTDDNTPSVAAICRRVDGIPLAIELAAARCRLLNPQGILAGLDDAFRILSGGSRAVMARQQTLDASITWSYDLLSPSEQTLLRRLAVFVDGWTLDAAEAICPDPDPEPAGLEPLVVFDALDRLVDHSLVYPVEAPTGLRFGMLETVRQYATRLLAADPVEQAAAQGRHSSHFTGWVSALGDSLLLDESAAQDAVTADRANVLAAIQWAIDEGSSEVACQALAAVAMLLAREAWVPLSHNVLAQADQLLGNVEEADQWRIHLVRWRVLALRSDPLSELESLETMRRCAESTAQPLGVAVARCQSLVILSVTGAPVFDELREIVEGFAEGDEAWAVIFRDAAALMAAYTGNLNLYDSIRSRGGQDDGRPARGAMRHLAHGAAAFFRGDPLTATAALAAARTSGRLEPGTSNMTEGFLAFAGADLGRSPDLETEIRLRRSSDVDGNVIAGIAADGLAVYRLLLADDLAAADELHRGVVERWTAIGAAGSAFHPNHPLVAAGLGRPPTTLDPRAEVAPIVAAESQRARAEYLVQSGDTAGALDAAHAALKVEISEGLRRGAVHTLECIARILGAAGRTNEAVRITGACTAFRAERSLIALPCLQRLTDDARDRARAALGDDAFEQALNEGATLSLEAAAEYSQRLRVAHASSTVGWNALSPTETRVAELVAEGLTNPQVAKELLMGTETVKTHLSKVFAKLGVANRKELIVAASRRAAERHR